LEHQHGGFDVMCKHSIAMVDVYMKSTLIRSFSKHRNETEVVLLAGYFSENMLDKTQILTCQKGN
jgi:hypothetical protein